jgi:hypothetical protein
MPGFFFCDATRFFMKQKGSVLVIVLMFILLAIGGTITLMKSMEARARMEIERNVFSNAQLILVAFNDYFIAECSAAGNSNAVTAPGSVSSLVSLGYLPKGTYKNPFGNDFSLSLSHAGVGTVLTITVMTRDAEQASRMSRYASGAESIQVSGNAVRISRRVMQFEESDYRQDASAFEGKLCV